MPTEYITVNTYAIVELIICYCTHSQLPLDFMYEMKHYYDNESGTTVPLCPRKYSSCNLVNEI